MKIEPLANRVICTLIEEDRVLKSGLVMPDIAHRNRGLSYGEVIAVGPGRYSTDGKLIRVHVDVGDVVMFPTQAASVLVIEDDAGFEIEVLLMQENDVIAKVQGLKRASRLMGLDGHPLLTSLSPQSSALPDVVYENCEGIDRSVSDLKQVNAPPDVIHEVASENVDQREYEPDLTEH